jgi:putative nucleotidyltransferase with HDIG domain
MPFEIINNRAVKNGIIGAMVGVFAPVFYTLIELAVYHSDMTFASYLRSVLANEHEELISYLFITGSIFVMGLAGALTGIHHEKDLKQRERIESANRELSALNSVSEIIARTKEIDTILYLVLKETLSLSFLGIEKRGAIFIRDHTDPGMLNMAAQINLAPHLVQSEKKIKLGYCLCGKAALTGDVITSSDCFKDKDHTTSYDGMTTHGHIVIPIKNSHGVMGVMTCYLPPDTVPSEQDIRVLSAINSQLAVAIENFGLLRSVSEAKEDVHKNSHRLTKNYEALKSLVEVDRIIMSAMERDEMLYRVGAQIRQIVPVEAGGIALRDDSGDYVYTGGWGLDLRNGDLVLKGGTVISRSIKTGKSFFRPNLLDEANPTHIDRILTESGVRSIVYAPIIRKGATAGFFFLGSHAVDGISLDDQETATTFASRMGIALEHSRLFCNLEQMSLNIVHVLATAIDAKSPWTKGHSERVAEYSMMIAEKMGLSSNLIERLRMAGLLHDIGKIGTYDILLDKAGKLTEAELALVRQHPDRGCEIIAPIKEFKDILPAVRHHHERWDGTGYPCGLKGEEIPLVARILCVADSFDTMTADRPYRPSIGLENAVQELEYCSGTHFAPEVVEVFLQLISERGPSITKGQSRPYMKGQIFASFQDYRA